jgi:SpoVK/Ycf46/Vps4 family AAA+-type ATPase
LFGPPGCAKTSAIHCACSQARLPLLATSPSALFSAFVGESEAQLRHIFATARRAAPCVIFIDEIDTLVGSRGLGEAGTGGSDDSGGVKGRVLSTLLNEMDGVGIAEGGASGAGVVVVGATNRPWAVDAALMRPGIRPPDNEAYFYRTTDNQF